MELQLKTLPTEKAFTLVELLTVIAITAMLSAFLLPALNRARQQARTVCCLSNLRQMSIASKSYALENADRYPLAYYTTRVNGIRYYYAWDFTSYKDWSASPATEVIEPGLLWQGDTHAKVQQCPSFRGRHNWLTDPYTGYNYNTSYIGINETTEPVSSAKMSEVGCPAQTALFGDGQFASGANKFMRAPFSNPRDASFSDPGRIAGAQGYRHLNRTNVAFCDGHVESRSERFTDTDALGQSQMEDYNRTQTPPIGFLSPDNRLYDLR